MAKNATFELPSTMKGVHAVVEDEDGDDEGTWNRSYVKTASMNSLKSEMKRAAKNNRTDSKKATI